MLASHRGSALSGVFTFVQLSEGALGFLQEEEAEERDDQTSNSQDLEEGAVGSCNRFRSGFSSTPHPKWKQAEDCEVGHCTDVSVAE